MARRLMGCTSADMAVTDTGAPAPGAGPFDVWSAREGGTQLTDLTDLDGVAIEQVTFMPDGYLRYYTAADDVLPAHWIDTGEGERIAVRPVDLTGPAGPPPEIAAGTVTVTDLPNGESATAELTLTETEPGSYDLDASFGIPAGGQGATGPANSLSIGSVTTVPVGGSATAAISGTPPSQTLDLGIPTGATGSPGADGAAIGGLLTTKGDLAGRSSSAAVRVPVGSDGQVLLADSTATAGVSWVTIMGHRRNAASGRYVVPGDTFGTVTGLAVDRILVSPLIVGKSVTVDALSVEVTAATATRTIRLVVYRLGPTDWAQVATTGDLTVSSGVTGVLTGVLGSPVSLPPGIYAAGLLAPSSATGVTYRAVATNSLIPGLLVRNTFDVSTARPGGMVASASTFGGGFGEEPSVPAVGMRIQ